MKRKLRKELYKIIDSGWAAKQIYRKVAATLFYHLTGDNASSSDKRFISLKNDVERIIKAMKWDRRKILNQLDLIEVV